jgi:hypothetical protein
MQYCNKCPEDPNTHKKFFFVGDKTFCEKTCDEYQKAEQEQLLRELAARERFWRRYRE